MSTSNELKQLANEIICRFDALGVEVEPIEIKQLMKSYRYDFDFPADQAAELVAHELRFRNGITQADYENAHSDSGCVLIDDIQQEAKRVTIRAHVDEIWNPTTPKIEQVGLLKGDSGKIKFTSVEDSVPKLETQTKYVITNAITSLFNDRYEIILNGQTSISVRTEQRSY